MFQFNKTVLTGMMLLVVSFTCHVVQAVGNPAVLFSDAKGAKSKKVTPARSGGHRTYARANVAFLFDNTLKANNKDKLPEIQLDFFPGIKLVGKVTYLEPTPAPITGLGHWEGELINVAGDFSITASLRKNSRLLLISANLADGRAFQATCDENYICQIDGVLETPKKPTLPVNP